MKYLKNLSHKPAVCLMLMTIFLSPFAQTALAHCPHDCSSEAEAVNNASLALDIAVQNFNNKVDAYYTAIANYRDKQNNYNILRAAVVATAAAFAKSPNYATYLAWVVAVAACWVAKRALTNAMNALNAAYDAMNAAFQNMCDKALALVLAQSALEACQNNTSGHPCCP